MDDRWRDATTSYIEKDQGNEMIVIFWSSDSKWEIVRVCGARTPTDVKFKDSEVSLPLSALDWQVRGADQPPRSGQGGQGGSTPCGGLRG